MATTRTITGTILAEDGTAWASKSVVFDLLTDFATTSADIVLNKTKTATTGVDGTFTVSLAVPDADAWQYNCVLPDGTSFVFNLEAGAAITLDEILADTNLSATVSPSTLSAYLRINQVLDEDDMVSDSAVYPPTQQSVAAYVAALIVAEGSVHLSGTPVANDIARFTNLNTIEGLSYAEFKAALDLEIGTDIQAYDAVLDATTASFTTDDETKLDGIEALATADMSAAEIITAVKTVDGAASGLDADLLDGQEAAAFAAASHVSDTANPHGVTAVQAGAEPAGLVLPYDAQLGFDGVPGDSDEDFIVIPRDCIFKRTNPSTNAVSGYAYAGELSTATATFELYHNATKIEEIEWTVANGAVGNFSGDIAATDVSISAGDRLRLVAPASADASLADIRVGIRLEVDRS